MASSEIKNITKSLQSLNLIAADEQVGVELGNVFEKCTQLKTLIDNTSLSTVDDEIQEAIGTSISSLEKCTLMVNDLQLFSSNETAEELQTSSMKYLLLPAYLGSLHLLLKTSGMEERLKNVEKADVYFKDFILRCINYELCGASLRGLEELLESDHEKKENPVLDPELIRKKKIESYKRKKELEDREKSLKPSLERTDAEEQIREYCLTLIEKWLLSAEEEMKNSATERKILHDVTKGNKDPQSRHQVSVTDKKPLKPIIITKNKIQKEVFGLGYPSIPVLTIEDFYRQRFEKQIQEIKEEESSRQSREHQNCCQKKEAEPALQLNEEQKKELLLEQDDPATLAKARAWDDWKDDNPRGAGNRYNKG